MKIAEIFYSIQGEGKLAGVPSVFVRVSGCNLRCVWCDTPYASWEPEGREMGVEETATEVERHGASHVVLTGGEPMMFRETAALIRRLKQVAPGTHITVETAGTLWLEDVPAGGIDLGSVSPKLANSTPTQREGGRFAAVHERQRENLHVLERFALGGDGRVRACQWKFVIASPGDIAEMEALLGRLSGRLGPSAAIRREDILLMPEGIDGKTLHERSAWLAEVCKEKGYRLSPRLHVLIWGNRRGT